MNVDSPRTPKSARRAAFPKWAFVGAIAGAALISACSQPSDSQKTAPQPQAADEQARKEADEKAWADAKKTDTVAGYTAYLKSFVAHVSEASQRIVALIEAADEKAWADAEKVGTAAAYTGYIQIFGDGAHSAQARQRVSELSRKEDDRKEADEKAWFDAVRTDTPAALTAYIQSFSSGAHVAEARERLAVLEQARKDAEKAGAPSSTPGAQLGAPTTATPPPTTAPPGAPVAPAPQPTLPPTIAQPGQPPSPPGQPGTTPQATPPSPSRSDQVVPPSGSEESSTAKPTPRRRRAAHVRHYVRERPRISRACRSVMFPRDPACGLYLPVTYGPYYYGPYPGYSPVYIFCSGGGCR
jgi:hypothetical protein